MTLAITPREQAIADLARLGVAHKVIALDLQLSPSVVSHTLGRLARRMNLGTRLDLIRHLGHVESGSPERRDDDPRLTDAERATIQLALVGLRNSEIATRRSVAARTVANQLASAYRKLGVGSRAELAAWSSGARAA